MPLNHAQLLDQVAAYAPPKKRTHLTLLGGDPEVFIKERATGRIVTSEQAGIGGTKGHGKPFGPAKYKFKMLEDNVAMELNFEPRGEFYAFIESINGLRQCITDYLYGKGYEIVPTVRHEFAAPQLATPKAQVFGCDPDFTAYDTDDRERVVDPTELGNLRFCGGHLHFGFENPHRIPKPALAIFLDMFIGLPSIQVDTQGERRKYYGLAGLYRPKPYGIEYRTMSNWWLRPEQDSHAQNMFRECFWLMSAFNNSPDALSTLFDRMPLKDIQVAINMENKRAAREIWAQARAISDELELSLGHSFMMYGKP